MYSLPGKEISALKGFRLSDREPCDGYKTESFLSLRVMIVNAMIQMITERREPIEVASPIGNNVSGNQTEVR